MTYFASSWNDFPRSKLAHAQTNYFRRSTLFRNRNKSFHFGFFQRVAFCVYTQRGCQRAIIKFICHHGGIPTKCAFHAKTSFSAPTNLENTIRIWSIVEDVFSCMDCRDFLVFPREFSLFSEKLRRAFLSSFPHAAPRSFPCGIHLGLKRFTMRLYLKMFMACANWDSL